MANRRGNERLAYEEPTLGRAPEGDPRESRGQSVSEILRTAREGVGDDLRDVAGILRIRLAHLQAIEDGRFQDLPGSPYAAGFVRTYSDYLGLDSDAVVRRFKEETGGQAHRPDLHFPEPATESRTPGLGLLLAAVVLAAVAFGGWYVVASSERQLTAMVPELPERLAALVGIGSGGEGDSDVGAVATMEGGAEDDSPADTLTDGVAESRATDTGGGDSGAVSVPGVGNFAGSPVEGEDSDSGPTIASARLDTGRPGTGADGSSLVDTRPLGSGVQGDAIADAGESAQPLAAGEPGEADASDGAAGPESGAGEQADGAIIDGDEATEETTGVDSDVAALTDGADNGLAGQDGSPGADRPEPTGDGRLLGDTSGQSRIALVAQQDSWVQIRDGDGSQVFESILRPGDVYWVPDQSGLQMVTGNAGGLEFYVEGDLLPPIGNDGEVRRGVVLTGEALRGAVP